MTEEDFNYWIGLEHSDGTNVSVKDRACFLTELKNRYFKVMRENIGISSLELKVKTLEKENEDMRNLNAELTDENADLQHRLDVAQGFLDRDKEYEGLKELWKIQFLNDVCPKCQIRKENSELETNLDKAREIIEIMFPIFKTYYLNQPIENYKNNIDYIDVLKRAEQFLKENE